MKCTQKIKLWPTGVQNISQNYKENINQAQENEFFIIRDIIC